MIRRTRSLLLALAAFAALTACGSDKQSGESMAAAPAPAQQSAPDAKAGSGKAQQPSDPAPVGRKLTRGAQLALTTPEVGRAVDRARQAAVSAGGYTGAERAETSTASLDLVVPADKLDSVLAELATFGQVVSRSQSAQDVTEQVVDVESRLATERKSVERVRALLDRATTISEITSLETELTKRESDLESLQTRHTQLAGSVATSKITLTVTTPPPAPPAKDSGFLPGLTTGWHAFLTFGSATLTALGAIAPFAALLAIPATALYWRLRRKSAAAKPTQHPATS
ncbi:DUF4349 domain-containing protein [Amycolatopsis anabasis]|uniref:DUF4349 domain-containing protein n=1 Tax=Amycolatopsis anabasis TaxID=1840409 RepID=UPI00131BE7D8|nr:DUF4349 domain-containing protein [Amycolatopsis anabasis]